MRRSVVALATMLALAAISSAAPLPGAASCANTSSLREVAEVPGTAVFTGHAASGIAGSQDLVFVVDRWFHGGHAAREVRLLGSTAVLHEAGTIRLVPVARAEVVAGDAIGLTVGEPVLVVADWVPRQRLFAVRFCTVAGVTLASPEGRAALAEAEAAFGPGRPSGQLPDTGTAASTAIGEPVPPGSLPEWWLPVLAGALATTALLAIRPGRRR